MATKKKVGFAFSGGSARSSAHLGIIKALNEHSIKADCVSGTSGGAIAGTLYAAGLSIAEMKEFAGKGKLSKLIKLGLPIQGLTSLEYLGELLEEYVGTNHFEDLDIPLFITVTNLMTGGKEVFNSGPLYDLVMASCAIPIIFKPVTINEQIYVDGGIFDNMPVAPLQEHCDIIIGMNVMPCSTVSEKKLEGMVSILKRTVEIAVADNSNNNYKYCDIVIEPKAVLDYELYDFGSSEALFEIGYQAALEKVDSIKQLLVE